MLRFVAGLFALLLANVCLADENPPLLLRHPTVSATQIVFVYGGDLWSVAKEGGTAQRLTAANGAASRPVFSPDGSEIAFTGTYDGKDLAYVPLDHAFEIWKRYRGGRTSPIWIAKLSDSSVTTIPRDNSNDFNPMWVGDRVFFLSDRDGPMSLLSYDTKTKGVSVALKNDGLDFKSASAGPGAIVIEQFGAIWLYDLKSATTHKVDIRIPADL